MFIVVIGTKASGKEAVASQLVQALGFTRLHLAADSQVDDTDGKTTFNSAKDILKFVTPRWRTNYVTTDVTTPVDLYLLWKRPFVLVVGVDAPVSLRYRRHCIRAASKETSLTLEEFVEADDNLLYTCQDPPPVACNTADLSTSLASIGMNNSMENSLKAVAHLNTHKSPLSPIIPQTTEKHDLNLKRVLASANVTITNTFAAVEDLYEYMDKIDLANGERLRPSWDTYFMLLSELASHRSNCMKRRVGCILVKDNQIIATGYNGTPKGVTNCNEGGCPRCNAGTPCGVSLDHCLCIHAEENALLEAGRGRVRSAADVVLYCNTCPCLGCAKKIVQVGVKVVVYSKGYGMDDLTLKLFSEAKVIVRQHTPPTLSMEIGSP
ncbi:Deoxycytidine monophosphate (dCMP) deaminase [Coemansia sp. RSA 1972]|nr:Deoxycytidine monophosphate (dCMP) deaminase [Coemansia sp. RSA 1972]